MPAYRLVSVLDAPERSHASRFVGREAELARIVEAWERRETQSRCELVTVVGDAGVGKSRLVAEALAASSPCRPRALSALRRGDHLLAGGRGGEAARQRCRRIRGGGGDPFAAGRVGGGDERRTRSRGRSASCSRSRRRWSWSSTTCSGARRRSSIWSSRRRCSRSGRRSAAVHGAAGAARAAARLAEAAAPGAADTGAGGRDDRGRRAGGSARADRARGGRQPAVHLRDARDGGGKEAEVEVPADAEGAAGGAARPARRGGTEGAGAGRGGG